MRDGWQTALGPFFVFKSAQLLSDTTGGCAGGGERGALLAWQQQTVAKPEKGRAGFYIPAPSIPSMEGIFFEMFVSQISRFSNFKGQLQAALGGSREFCDLIK